MWRLSDRQRVTVTGFVIYLLLLLSPGPHPLHAGVLDADLRAQSIGFPAAGRLRHAVQIADKTPHLEVLPYQRHRSIHYATTYLAELLKRTAASLAKAHPGNVLQLGNSSRRRGGPIPFSISHQVGRDVDIAFQVTTLRGKPAKLKNLTVFGDDGLSKNHVPRLRFDVVRNWRLVKTLLNDRHVQVQWIFVSEGLKKLLLNHAKTHKEPPSLLARAEKLLHQPMLAGAHDDHFHLRIYCSRADRLAGCLDHGPFWPWIDDHQKAVDRRGTALMRFVERGTKAQRLKALRLLGAIRAHRVVPRLMQLLSRKQGEINDAIIEAVALAATEHDLDDLLDALSRPRPVSHTRRLFSVLERLQHPRSLDFLGRLARGRVAVRLQGQALIELRKRALRLIGKIPEVRSVPLLIGLLDDRYRSIRAEAARSLHMLTNHNLGISWYRVVSSKKQAERVARWRAFWKTYRARGRLRMLLDGFRRAGHALDTTKARQEQIDELIKLVGLRAPYLSANAQYVLNQFTGLHVNPHRWSSKKKCLRFWRIWWERERRIFSNTRQSLPGG
ncbi:MAG: penicillin-insensitive murein endopeptidase [Myxococcales bacterium]|nr:penicillin-insensitive murein endopeptidase [Myxococcales bacterium]